MAEFLDSYGVADARRGRRIKQIIVWGLAIVLVSGGFYLYFRTWPEERVMNRFLAALEQKDFQGAYKMWCPPENPCKYNPFEKFEEDWGPSTPYSHGAAAKVDNIDYCGDGVVFNISYPNADPLVLWVERSTDLISFAPPDWQRCPGRHWQFRQFFKTLFSS